MMAAEILKEIKFLRDRVAYDRKRIKDLERLLLKEEIIEEINIEVKYDNHQEGNAREAKKNKAPEEGDGEEEEEEEEEEEDHQKRGKKVNIRNRNPCLYCQECISHVSRHMSRLHGREAEVKEILEIDIKNPKSRKENLKKRRELWLILIKKGRVAYNIERKEKIFPVYRKKMFENKDGLKPCPYCMDLYYMVRRHMKTCSKRSTDLSKDYIKSQLRFFKK